MNIICTNCNLLRVGFEGDKDYAEIARARCTGTPRNRCITWSTTTYICTPKGMEQYSTGIEAVWQALNKMKKAPAWCPRCRK